MSSPVDIVRELTRRFDAGERESLLEFFAPNCVWDVGDGIDGAGRGRTAIHDNVGSWYEFFDHAGESDIIAAHDLGGRIVEVVRYRMRHRASGHEFREVVVWIWDFGDDGLIHRVRIRQDVEAALREGGVKG